MLPPPSSGREGLTTRRAIASTSRFCSVVIAGAKMSGHVHLLEDGTACNDKANNSPYNAAGSTSPIDAGLDYCSKIEGSHKITLELHNDDHSAVKDSSGATVSDSIMITASSNGADAG